MIGLFNIIDKGTKAVPATKYAVGILGLVASVAIIKQFKIDFETAFWGTIILLALMIILVVFAKLTQTASDEFVRPIRILMWAFVLLFIINCVLLSTATFIGWPKIHHIFDRDSSASTKEKKSIPKTDTTTKVKIDIRQSPGTKAVVGNGNKVK